MKVYIIEVYYKQYEDSKVSQTGYSTYEKAIEFINTRNDKPKKISSMIYESDEMIYKILEVVIE